MKKIRPAAAVGFGGYPTVPPMLAALSRRGADGHPRGQRRHRPRQPLPCSPCLRDCDQFRPGQRRREVRGQDGGYRQPGAPGRARSRGRALSAARAGRPVQPPRLRRQPGRAASCPILSRRRSRACPSELREPAQDRPAVPPRGSSSVSRCLSRDRRRRPSSRPSSATCPRASRPATSSSAASGASTIAELAVIGRPAIMVPLPHALDQDQKANAQVLARAGGGWMIEQREMTPERLAGDLTELITHPVQLDAAAARRADHGAPRRSRAPRRSGRAGGGRRSREVWRAERAT